jgi:carbonic anhydrase
MQRNRRTFLLRAAGALAACACCPPGAFAAEVMKKPHEVEKVAGKVAEHHAPHWSYEGATGPAEWGQLSADFKTCAVGTQQTPIDLKGAVPASPKDGLVFDYKSFPLKIINNGHTIQVNAASGSSISIAGERYDLVQFHFHHPSEHLLSGKTREMELHLVHKSASGALAVVGVFITLGAENAALKPVFSALPAKAGPEVAIEATVEPAKMLPSGPYYRYMGSLTTPPCSESVTWSVYEQPIEASKEQIATFAALFANNARPAQAVNNRFLLEAGL